ncbi:putative ras-responsive element-binding protein 1-like isoform X4 [Penaeus vannamei]|uniref:Putative ras-responsive element-binding protein 1-like isoform X4 n=1 Tax=Penaeus vannamei TaxID=6689 RepID=A0A3R7PWM8_PENVA|nr:putative ras-responsive element-binding protein 1-like isoform X4 [Penaeus vannamei]
MVVSTEEYRHKIFGVIPSPDHQPVFCETDMAAATASPEPKGTLTPPGSSPLRAECDPTRDSSHNSTPLSPEAPPTPDSAHMANEPTNHSAARLQPTSEREESNILTNQEPLSGAKKRKAAKVHKVETACGSEGEGEAGLTGNFSCPVCEEVLPAQHEFTQHIRKHNHVIETDNGTKVYCCGICKKQLSSNSSLDRHMLVHSGERPDLASEEDTSSPRKRHLEDEESVVSAKAVRLNASEVEEEELTCPACGVEQPSQHALEQHVENIHPEYQVACTTCQVGFKNYRALHLHNSMVHHTSTASPPQVDLTLTDFSSPKFPLIAKEICERDRVHQQPGEGVGVHRCQLCHITFPCAESWLMHMREHAAASTGSASSLRCLRCDLSFSNVVELSHHHQRHLCEEPQPGKEGFLRVLDLLKQQEAESASATSMAASIFASGLGPHLSMQPPGQHSPAPADSAKASPEHPSAGRIAATTTTTASSVAPLLSTAPGLSHDEQFARGYREMKLNGQYPCKLCKEVFANLRKLKSHNLVHMVAPPYRCNLCSFFSNDKNTLKEHMKSHKGDTPYECNLCNLAFTTKANCERHIKNIHGRQSRDEVKGCMTYVPQEEGASTDRSLDTVCHICHIDCKARSVLRDHIRSSHPEGMTKPFSCKLCGGAFSSENDVMRHVIQQHSEAATGPTLDSLVVSQAARDDHQDHHDLTPVESLLSFSKLPLTAMPLTTSHQPPPPALPLPFSHNAGIPTPLVPGRTLTPSVTPTLTPVPSVNDVKCEQVEPEDLSKPRKEECKEPDEAKSPEPTSESATEVLKIPKPPFSLGMYPQPLPLCSPFSPHQYSFLMNPYNGLHHPVRNLDPAFFEEYQKELKRGLQLTSGGGLLSGGFLQSSPSFSLSALAMVAAHRNPLRIPRPDIRSSESKSEDSSTSDSQSTPISKPGDEDVMHFTIRNSVLMKKPKQRRYRTERPWRCDLCDKGFTLRSNMERHMKQQHPDVWQHRPRGVNTPRSESDTPTSVSDTPHTISETESSGEKSREDSSADLASVHTLLSTASSQSFPFFGSEGEEEVPGEDDSTSSNTMSEEAKRSAYSSAPQKQKCPFCQRKFPWSSSLVRHIRTHTGQKPYLCPVCHFPFTTKSNCDRHLLRKHPDSPHTLGGDRPYRCSKCPGAAFTSLESLRKHEVFKHEKASDTAISRDDARPFRCHVCEVPLASREVAVQHVKEAHPENFQKITSIEPVTAENNNDPLSPTPDSTTTERVSCMFCLNRYWSLAELKQHVTTQHTNSSPVLSAVEQKEGSLSSPAIKTEIKEERKDETEGSDFISNLLGTRRAVVDHLLTSKSADDAAKLLGVR